MEGEDWKYLFTLHWYYAKDGISGPVHKTTTLRVAAPQGNLKMDCKASNVGPDQHIYLEVRFLQISPV